MFEFEDVLELDVQYDKFHFTKQIDGQVVVYGSDRKWIFNVSNVKQKFF